MSTEYRIVEYKDGNGTPVYRIQWKGWFFWKWVYNGHGSIGEDNTREEAERKIKRLKYVDNSSCRIRMT